MVYLITVLAEDEHFNIAGSAGSHFLCSWYRHVGQVVKTSASRVADPVFDCRFRQ